MPPSFFHLSTRNLFRPERDALDSTDARDGAAEKFVRPLLLSRNHCKTVLPSGAPTGDCGQGHLARANAEQLHTQMHRCDQCRVTSAQTGEGRRSQAAPFLPFAAHRPLNKLQHPLWCRERHRNCRGVSHRQTANFTPCSAESTSN